MIILIAAAIILLVWLAVVWPVEVRFRARLQHLDPSEVERISLNADSLSHGNTGEAKVTLTESERREFLRLLAESRVMHPNHPKGGWTCFATITTKSKQFYFPIHATSNNGTIIFLLSNGTDGWNMGTLRNDALKAFVEAVFSNYRSVERGTNHASLTH